MKPYLVIVNVLAAIAEDVGILSNHMNFFVFNFLVRFSLRFYHYLLYESQ